MRSSKAPWRASQLQKSLEALGKDGRPSPDGPDSLPEWAWAATARQHMLAQMVAWVASQNPRATV
eukprot:6081405-Pyramimonas_sp.AAC.1